jgi:putative membrane protein
MIGFILRWFANIISLLVVINFVPGINIDSSRTLVVAALALGLVNALLRPFILLFTLPLNVLSLGLLTLFVNGFLFYGVSKIIKGFYVTDFWNAFWGALCFSLVSFLFNLLINPQEKKVKKDFQNNAYRDPRRRGNIIDVEASHEKKPGQGSGEKSE